MTNSVKETIEGFNRVREALNRAADTYESFGQACKRFGETYLTLTPEQRAALEEEDCD